MEDKNNLKMGDFVDVSVKTIGLLWANFRGLYVGQMLLIGCISVLGFVQPAVLALVINHVSQRMMIEANYYFLVALLVVVSVLPTFVYTVQGYLDKLTYFKFERFIELGMMRFYGKLDVSQHEDAEVKDLLTRVAQDGQWRIKNSVSRLVYLFQDILSLGIASVILIQAQWWTFPLLVLATVPELIISTQYGRDVWSISSSQSEDRRFFWNIRYHFTFLPYLLELKLFQNVADFTRRLDELFATFLQGQLDNERRRMLRMMVAQGISQFANATVVVFFIYQAMQGNLLVGTLTFLIATTTRFRQSLSGFFMSASSYYQDALFVHDFFQLRALPRALRVVDHPVVIGTKTIPLIEFRDVSFAYPGTNVEILKNVNLTIQPGTTVAMVGSNGAGKSTLVKLLCRFYDPSTGSVLIDGIDLREIDLDTWYDRLGILFQDYAHYHFTVADSIRVGRSSVRNNTRMHTASVQSGADEFIQKWSGKYRQQLGREFKGGVELSTGQWQKLALARLFYRDPSVFVLDEPTASLDVEAEAKIFAHLQSLGKQKSIILISHRFSTVQKADLIVVLEDGCIKECGSHRQLLDLKGTYARLFSLQANDYAT